MAVFLIFLSALVNIFEGIFIKRYNSRHSAGGFLFTGIVSLFSMLFFVVTDKSGFSFSPQVCLYGFWAGICYCSASIFTYLALSIGSFALTMLITSYSVVFSIIYGIVFLKEPATLFTYSGIILILISIYFVGSSNNQGIKKVITPYWVIAVAISLLGQAFFSILKRMQQIKFDDLYTNEFMIVCLGFSAAVMFTLGLFREKGRILYILKHGGAYAALSGLSNGTANMLGLIVTTLIPISIFSPLTIGMKNLLSFLVAVIIFRERFKMKQLIGVITGTLALILFNL